MKGDEIMKKVLAFIMACLMLVPLMTLAVEAKSIDHVHNDEQMEILLNEIKREKEKNALKTYGPEPAGPTKTVEVILVVPYGANIQNRYFYQDQHYSGWIPQVSKKLVTYPDGMRDYMVTYRGEVNFIK